jgi:hypothetical protein
LEKQAELEFLKERDLQINVFKTEQKMKELQDETAYLESVL